MQIRDIKPILELNDYLLYLLIVVFVLVVVSTIFLVVLKLIKKKRVDRKKILINQLRKIEFKDSKQTAYKITLISRKLAKTDKEKELLNNLLQRLQKYKYHKDNILFKEEDKRYLDVFIGAIDE